MPRSHFIGLGAALTILLVVTGTPALADQATPSAEAAPRDGVDFGPCPEDVAADHPDMRCAWVDVPMDYSAPDDEQVRLLVSKLPAREPAARQGSLLVNPGGPGASGVEFAGELDDQLPQEVRRTHDLVSFDTRHSAHSTPISCVDPDPYWKQPLPDPDAPETREVNWQRAEEYARGCAERAGQYLPHLTTPNNARDMDRVRAALGEERISYLGYSYGTYLGAVYGELFGNRVDRMVLDSSVDPTRSQIWYGINLNQDVAAQRRLDRYFDWIAEHDDAFHLGTTPDQVRSVWRGVQNDLRRQARGPLGPSEFIDLTFNALYGETDWIPLADALRDFRDGDDRRLVDLVSPMDRAAENSNAIYNAVECADAPWPAKRSQWERDSTELAREHPLAAWYNSWTVAPCRTWDAPSREPVKITGTDLPPVLMFNSVHDVATPYEGAQRMHRALPTSVLVTEQDAGKHGVFALAGNPDADRIGANYLVRGDLPADDVDIPGHPRPSPTEGRDEPRMLDLPTVRR